MMYKHFSFFVVLFIVGLCYSCESRIKTILVKEKKLPHKEFTINPYVSLCGEVIDLTNIKNRERFDREFTIAVWDKAQVFMWVKRSARFFPYIEKRLREAELPDDLKYLAVAESSLHTHIRSRAGALGMWQFMPQTAKKFGLVVKRNVMDERYCFKRSTDAAVLYFYYLDELFDSWLVMMASYNCGEWRMNREMKRQNTNDYLELDLPRETERYIFRIAAIKTILQSPEKYGYQLKKEQLYEAVSFDIVAVDIKQRYTIAEITHLIGLSYKEFREFNQKLLSRSLPMGQYELMLPKGYEDSFYMTLAYLDTLPKGQRFNNREYIVQEGDLLSKIAWKTGVSVNRIKRLNGINGNRIRKGQKLIIRP